MSLESAVSWLGALHSSGQSLLLCRGPGHHRPGAPHEPVQAQGEEVDQLDDAQHRAAEQQACRAANLHYRVRAD